MQSMVNVMRFRANNHSCYTGFKEIGKVLSRKVKKFVMNNVSGAEAPDYWTL
jgi:hypothetical protein